MGNAFGSSLSGSFGGAFGSSGAAVARTGDSGSHGGSLTGASPTTKADGLTVCRVGDTYTCLIHGPNPITSGSSIFRDNGAALARVGDTTLCGATITTGSPTWSCA